MASVTGSGRRSFPELVGQNVQQAVAYITAQGFVTQVLRANDPMTKDLRMNRVRIIVDPTRTIVIQVPVVG